MNERTNIFEKRKSDKLIEDVDFMDKVLKNLEYVIDLRQDQPQE